MERKRKVPKYAFGDGDVTVGELYDLLAKMRRLYPESFERGNRFKPRSPSRRSASQSATVARSKAPPEGREQST